METIESILNPITGYLISITRDTVNGWYEMEIGIHKGWVFDENKEIKCEVVTEGENGKIIKISPKNNKIIVDDLVTFVKIIIETNKKIAEKENEFTSKMQKMKGDLEKEVNIFYKELDELKINSFKNINVEFEKSLNSDEKIETRGRKKKNEIIVVTGTTTGGGTMIK
jgi:ribosomal protein L24